MHTASLPSWPLPSPQGEDSATWILEDPASRALLQTIEQIAPSEASVLLVGDSGADKEMLARHIHRLSPRRNGPFVAVNCGALAESLVHAELFGHERGAFAGAFDNLPGRFEEAHLGTLLLDEIDDLPAPLQGKLMRVLQEKSVTRLGSSQRIAVDVRVLAASRRPLEQVVAANRFREDLYYQLGVVTLTVLPLRQRPGDILPLARHFIRSYCRRMHYAPLELSREAEQKLLAHSWPGNSRELENVIHRSLLLAQGLRIGPDALQLSGAQEASSGSTEDTLRERQLAASQLALDEALESLCDLHEQGLEQHVLNALLLKVWQRNRCNQARTARQLGVSRSVVRARLQRLGQLAAEGTAAKAEPSVPLTSPHTE